MFKRDYKELHPEEIKAKEEFDKIGKEPQFKGISISTREHFFKKRKITKQFPAIRYFDSLFPNNFINSEEFNDRKEELLPKLETFNALINDPKTVMSG